MDYVCTGPDVKLTDREGFRKVLTTHWVPDELKTLCNDLEIIPYDSLGGQSQESKVDDLITWCIQRGCLYRLIEGAKQARANVAWMIDRMYETLSGAAGPQAITYFIATSASEDEIPARFGIMGDEFKRVYDHDSADCMIFDLSKPPEDWLKYVYRRESGLQTFDQIFFVAFEGIRKLRGSSVYDILRRAYGEDPVVWKDRSELRKVLKVISPAVSKRAQSALAGAAVASERQRVT